MAHLITSNESKIHNPSACVTDRDRDHQPKPWQVSSAMEFHYFRVHLLLSQEHLCFGMRTRDSCLQEISDGVAHNLAL